MTRCVVTQPSYKTPLVTSERDLSGGYINISLPEQHLSSLLVLVVEMQGRDRPGLYLILILGMGHTKVVNNTNDNTEDDVFEADSNDNTEDDVFEADSNDNTEDDVFEADSNGHLFKLQAPIVYTMDDLLMTMAVLLILLIMILIWYSLARALIYLAYHSEERRMTYQKYLEEDSVYEEGLFKHGVKL